MRHVETPQTFVYAAKIPAQKKIKGILFRHGQPVVVWDPKIVRLVQKLPYMKPAPMPEAARVAKASIEKTREAVVVPADWRSQHWKRRVAWAKAVSGSDVGSTAEADILLAKHMGEPEVAPAPVLAEAGA